MALIGKIREKSWLLVAVIGIAMLAFILGDLDSVFNSSGREDQVGIGTVNGEKVDEEQYNNALQNVRNQIFQNKTQQNQGEAVPLDENDEKNAYRQAWTAVVGEHLVKKELKEVGLIVDDIELDNVLYAEDDFNPSPAIAQAEVFTDSLTGEFSPNLVREYFESLEMSPDPEAFEQLQGTLDYVRQYRKEEKYNTLLGVGVHTTSLEGKEEYLAQKQVKNVAYVYQRFSKVPSNEVGEPMEDEIKAFYEANKNLDKYKQTPSRKIDYFVLRVTPSAEDTTRTENILNQMKSRFKKSKNDSAFVIRFSDIKEYSSEPTAEVPAQIKEKVENAEKGDVFGPYFAGEYMAVSKLVDRKKQSTATVRHILLSASSPNEKTVAQKRADSIIRVIKAQNNFEEMVTQFSEDPGSKETGGKYENFTEGTMVPTFNDFSFQKPIGTLGSVQTDYGVHIIEVLGREETEKPVLATVNKAIEVTKTSLDNTNSVASSIIYDIDDLLTGKTLEEKVSAFRNFAKENGYNLRNTTSRDKSPGFSEFGSTAEGRLLRLAYEDDAVVGKLSSAPIRDGERIIVAMLTMIQEDEMPEYELVKSRMKSDVRKDLQANYLIEQMEGRMDLIQLAEEIDAKFETEGITFSANNVAVGKEPVLIGTAFSGLMDGQLSVPVKGNNGVFVVEVENTVQAPETMDFSAEQAQLTAQRTSSLLQKYRTALTNSAEVVDNRKLRSYGIR